MAAFGDGAKIGLGDLFTTRCATTYAKLKDVRWHRPRRLSIARRSRRLTKLGARGYDAAKKGSGRKRHVAVDGLGLIWAMMITPASVQDRAAAKGLVKLLVSRYGRLQVIWADGGYLGALVQWVKQLRPFGKLRLEIVRRGDQTKGFQVLPKRWIVERTFAWLYKACRLCRDYEIRLDHSEAMTRVCMIRLRLKRLAKAS